MESLLFPRATLENETNSPLWSLKYGCYRVNFGAFEDSIGQAFLAWVQWTREEDRGQIQVCFLRTHTCTVSIFHCCYYKGPQNSGIKQHTVTIWQFYRLELQDGTHWTKVEVFLSEVLGKRLSPCFFSASRGCLRSLAHGPFPAPSSQHRCISLTILP